MYTDGICRESGHGELTEESFSELGLVLGFMGFGSTLELELRDSGNDAGMPCVTVFGKEGSKGASPRS